MFVLKTMACVMFKLAKIFLYVSFFPLLIIWWFLKGVFGTSYESRLTSVRGISKSKADLIRKHYRSKDDLRKATAEEIAAAVPGVGARSAKQIKNKFK